MPRARAPYLLIKRQRQTDREQAGERKRERVPARVGNSQRVPSVASEYYECDQRALKERQVRRAHYIGARVSRAVMPSCQLTLVLFTNIPGRAELVALRRRGGVRTRASSTTFFF